MEYTARFAEPSDLERLQALTRAALAPYEHEFSSTDCSSWAVVEQGGQVTVAGQFLVGFPVSRMDMLSVDLTLPREQRHAAVRALTDFGIATLKKAGASVIQCDVEDGAKGVRRMLKKHYGFEMGLRSNTFFRIL